MIYFSKLKKIIVSAAAVIILTSCTSIETLRSSTPKGDSFQKILFELYKEFAAEEAEKYDWLDSQHFIDKAMMIVYGHNVAPENPNDWKIPKEHLVELQVYYAELLSILKHNDIRVAYPDKLAKAQFYFDCWVEEQEENWQISDIKNCKTNFLDNLSFLKLHSAKFEIHQDNSTKIKNNINQHNIGQRKDLTNESLKKKKTNDHSKIKEDLKNNKQKTKIIQDIKSKEQIIEKSKENFQFKVYFEFDSDNLSKGAKNVIAKIANNIKSMKNKPDEISLSSFTDKAGNEDHNLNLSNKRARAVKDYLVKLGLDKSKIMIYAFGELDKNFKPTDSSHIKKRVEIAIVD